MTSHIITAATLSFCDWLRTTLFTQGSGQYLCGDRLQLTNFAKEKSTWLF